MLYTLWCDPLIWPELRWDHVWVGQGSSPDLMSLPTMKLKGKDLKSHSAWRNGAGTMLRMTGEFWRWGSGRFCKLPLLGTRGLELPGKWGGMSSWGSQRGTETGLLADQTFPARLLLSVCMQATSRFWPQNGRHCGKQTHKVIFVWTGLRGPFWNLCPPVMLKNYKAEEGMPAVLALGLLLRNCTQIMGAGDGTGRLGKPRRAGIPWSILQPMWLRHCGLSWS